MGTHYNTDIVLCDGPMNIAAYAKSARFEATCDELDTTPMGSTDGYQTLIAGATQRAGRSSTPVVRPVWPSTGW